MRFEEIFNKDGLYTADSFVEGYCFEIMDGTLIGVQYKNKDDILPEKHRALCYKGLFQKDYEEVFIIQSLFKIKTK
jgi:hypothetical protein